MPKADYPVTTGVRHLRQRGVEFTPRLYDYEEHGGTTRASQELGMPEHQVIKTLVMLADGQPLLVLMHGDRSVSTRNLAREIGAKHVEPCTPEQANKYTGYFVGGISPFGTRRPLPVYVEATIFELERMLINGGKRGFLVEITPADLRRALDVREVHVAIEE